MARWMVWLAICTKRLLLRKGFLLLLLSILLLPLGLHFLERGPRGQAAMGFTAPKDAFAEAAAQQLLKKGGGPLSFIRYESEEALKGAVARREVEAGFALDQELEVLWEKERGRGSVRGYTSPATTLEGLASDAVYSALLTAYAPRLLEQQLARTTWSVAEQKRYGQKIIGRMAALNQEESGSLFRFERLEGPLEKPSLRRLFPLQGFLAILVLLTAWITLLQWYVDEARGIYGAASLTIRLRDGLTSCLWPIVLVSLASFGPLIWQFGAQEGLKSGLLLLFYGLSLGVFLFGAGQFLKSPELLAALLPILLMGSLLVSPVLWDPALRIPSVRVVQGLFFPTYYLAFFEGRALYGASGLLIVGGLGGILIGLAYERGFVPKR
ncbi:hypothetical protein ABB02_00332 [Clostridiaceae bacterium JG1575]|nr:hypothetical protein ABB02_00332 [Clostridiaceae bacterium JG1575]